MTKGVKDGKRLARHIGIMAERVGRFKGAVAAAVHFTLYMAVNFCCSGNLSAKKISSLE